jgi:hypothetical protein
LANDNSQATIKLANTSTGQEFSSIISAPSTADYAVGKSVEWITERIPLSDDSSGDGWYPLTNFGVASFTNCVAVTSDGGSQGLTSAEAITMETDVFIDGTHLAFGQVVDGSTASITWQTAS